MSSTKCQVVIQLDAHTVQKTKVRFKGGNSKDVQWKKLDTILNERLASGNEKYSLSAFGIVLQINNEDTYLLSDAERLHS